jgi:preprotein translocase subunit SecD
VELTGVEGKLDQMVGIIERRVNVSGLTEARVRKQMPDKLIVELPGVREPEKALELIRKTAVLKFQHIPPDITVQRSSESKATQFYRENEEIPAKTVLDEAPTIMTGDELEPKCTVGNDPGGGGAMVLFRWKQQAGDKFREFTKFHIKQHLAIVLDGEVISAPEIRDEIGHQGQITGDFTVTEATELANLLNAGALPVPLTVEENRVVSATLGQDSINASLWAGLIGLLAVLVFMVAYYRLPGLLADLALIIYGLLILFALRLFNATLTLPGIAGIIISLGMAVDANVIIFERLKEELRTGKTIKSAIEAGFNRAWTAILDSNVCSLLTGFVLWSLGTPAIKGFAIALVIGVGVSMFTAITITRLFIDITADTSAAEKPAWFGV